MTDEPGTDPTVPPEEQQPEPSTEVVVLDRRRPVVAVRRWPESIDRARSRLLALREHPAAAVTVSVAATVGSALLTTGLRRALRGSALPVPSRSATLSVRGYVLHEVHVVQHVVHHIAPPEP
jgi:hypothetical protein